MSRDFPRSRRIEDQIQRSLSEIIRTHVRDPRLHGVVNHRCRRVPGFKRRLGLFQLAGWPAGSCNTGKCLRVGAGILAHPIGRASDRSACS